MEKLPLWRAVIVGGVCLAMVGRAGAAEPPAKLVFQMDLGVKNVQFAGLLVAERDGFYRAAGLDVEVRRLGKGASDYANITATVAATEGMVGSVESGLLWLRNAGAYLSSQPKAKLGEMARWVDFSVAAEAAKIAP
jgi:folate-dependent tRNA-U54 methylase TrmFO/GidA